MKVAEESDLTVYTLTDSGWPRPLVGGWPIPWVAPAERLSEVNEGRRLASIGGAVCQVCGEGWKWGEYARGFIVVDRSFNLIPGDYLSENQAEPCKKVFFLDGALMHQRCARLTAAMCPHVKNRSDLVCVRVPANDAVPELDSSGTLRPTYPAGDVEIVPWPT